MQSVFINSKPSLWAIVSLLFLGATNATDLSTLQLVQIISRHGDRAPMKPYPNDLYKNASVFSFNGWGELSEMGERQVYELGSFLRQRYDGFLPRKYFKKDFHIVSSDVDRTIMSAESNLAGLYELRTQLISSQDIFNEWQPVPIHTIPREYDNLINFKANCSRYDSLLKQFYNSEQVTNMNAEYKNFLDFVSENSGAELLSLQSATLVQDPLRCQRKHNLTLPTWVNDTVYDQLQLFRAITFTWKVGTDEMKRLLVGPMMGKLVENMQAKIDGNTLIVDTEDLSSHNDATVYRKMNIYSGHDYTISALLNTLNLFEPHVIEYAAALLIELHRNPETGELFIELYYRNDTTKEPYKVDTTSLCGSPCSFSNFSDFVHKFIPVDWNEECQTLLQASSPDYYYVDSSISFYKILLKATFAAIVFMVGIFFLAILLQFSSEKITDNEVSGISVSSYQMI